MKRRKGTDPRSKLIRALDRVTAEIIKLRDMRQCQKCGSRPHPQGCHWSHVLSRNKGFLLRWDLLNSFVLCNGCHRWWHSNPTASGIWFAKRFPARYGYLQTKLKESQTRRTIKTFELEEILKSHREKLKELKSEI